MSKKIWAVKLTVVMSYLLLLSFATFAAKSLASGEADLTALVDSFVRDHKALNIPEFDYSYEKNFQTIQDLRGIGRQLSTFDSYSRRLQQIARSSLSRDGKYLYDQFAYEINFNLERLKLEREFKANHRDFIIPSDGLANLPHHRRWYQLYVKRWGARSIKFSELWALGIRETDKVKREIKKIQVDLGYGDDDATFYRHLNDDSFLIKDEAVVLEEYRYISETVYQDFGAIFANTNIPIMGIKPIPNPNKDSPPGYYTDEKIFYFNFFGGTHNRRVMDWLFIHEAVPGHHYQNSVAQKQKLPGAEFMRMFWYPGYTEGWGAYAEHLGQEVGLYQDTYKSLGKWEWDLVRSTRVVLDIGINLLGWSNAKALRYWKSNIPNQDSIAVREIARMRRWPAQVISYKVGEDTILQLRKKTTEFYGKNFDLKKFHTLILSRGSIPLDVLDSLVNDDLQAEGKK